LTFFSRSNKLSNKVDKKTPKNMSKEKGVGKTGKESQKALDP